MLKINEMFETIQGEGFFTGVPSIFIRLQGCPVGCSWCDTKQTWDVEPKHETDFSQIIVKQGDDERWCHSAELDIVEYCLAHYNAKHVVITGGEPCQYDLLPLTAALEEKGFRCQIETSGTFAVQASANTWVTVSPKIGMKGKLPIEPSAMSRANEIKHPVGKQSDIDDLKSLLENSQLQSGAEVLLQPISQKPRATQLCIDTCIANNWRLSVQTHKYLNIA
ncbi:7-carboxy-7-deazaguanine synthase QueE [Vibrio sp. UCD-FRSSP16_10]|uniref:7-carboxy-7-deazaguanine synthase QueE n=1 Tax=unclassified Vibrio TaxID=2614977 RepID=UPI0007FE31F9|nr:MULTISPECIES: 7-carboxy-7-deazaguanine synthase QueE [unclassified Vibrio]OBT09499.1 7-carboxy-7-deazaguanine synthase QueE [Vibrio sp. UCD-FRSSP16_30]OBT19541.1 7-carboxy-7-deazaguanine synthase QueE [Vibrio sp. UCD-FRSSP16_10]